MKKSLLFVVCASLFASSFVAKAGPVSTTYISNLSQSPDNASPITATAWRAQKFKTDDSAATFTLDSVVLNFWTATDSSGNFFVKIYNSTGSEGAWLPNNSGVLGTLTGNANPSSIGQSTYTASEIITLQSNTNYWIVAGVSSGTGNYAWGYISSTTTTGTWSITATNTDAWSSTSGASWINNNGTPYAFSVNATAAVPEPSGVLLLVAGGGVLAFVRRRQVRKA